MTDRNQTGTVQVREEIDRLDSEAVSFRDDNRAQNASMNVRAVTRAIAILRSFETRSLQTLAEVASASGLDKGTTRRLLVTMMNAGFIVQDAETQRYGLGMAIRALAANVNDHFSLRAAASPVLQALARELEVTAFLSIYDHGAAVCLERVHAPIGMVLQWWPIGGNLALNCGGAPKVLLAHQPQEEIDRVLAEAPLVPLTPKSETNPGALKKRLAQIRKQGYEFALDDVALGLAALAVPILDDRGKVVCALSISTLQPQMVAGGGKPKHLPRLLEAAEEVRKRLGFAPQQGMD